MKLAIVLAPACLILASACSSTIDRGKMHRDLEGQGLEFSSKTVQEVEAIRPQLALPIRLAVAPPLWRSDPTWSREELAEIEAWEPELKQSGLVSELVVIPVATYEIGGQGLGKGWLEKLRIAAARHHADALLIVRDVDDVSQWGNFLAVLDLTIVGCWIVPGHQAESV